MLELADSGDVTILTLAHGKANALDLEFCEGLQRALKSITASALVITSSGGIFSAGVDLFRLTNGGADYTRRFVPALVDMLRELFLLPIPVVAAVNGHAIAGGCIMNAAADYRVMASGNGRIGVPELLVGVPFPALALEILRYAVPNEYLEELVYIGKTIPPTEALAKGLVDEIVEPATLLDRAVSVARGLAAAPARTFRIVKKQLRDPAVARAQELAAADAEALEIWSSPETHQHIRAYLAKTVGKK
jgi:enoyl-CoA hydratase